MIKVWVLIAFSWTSVGGVGFTYTFYNAQDCVSAAARIEKTIGKTKVAFCQETEQPDTTKEPKT